GGAITQLLSKKRLGEPVIHERDWVGGKRLGSTRFADNLHPITAKLAVVTNGKRAKSLLGRLVQEHIPPTAEIVDVGSIHFPGNPQGHKILKCVDDDRFLGA